MATVSPPLPSHRGLLDMVDEFRAQGIDRYVALPEIIVAGEDYAGKAAILEAIAGVSGLAEDEQSTRFAIELILRPTPHTRIRASILPDRNRGPDKQELLRLFDRNVEEADRNLHDVIDAAKRAMRLADEADNDTWKDVLRIELTGPELPGLTLVNLPCLCPAPDENEEPDAVTELVVGYMNRKRSIILAVVSAQTEFSLPRVIHLAHEADPDRTRTLGLITEPSKPEKGSESEASYVKLAQNRNVRLRLGWHVLEIKGRDSEAEDVFFRQSPWTDIDPLHLGIASLKPRLVHVLKYQILHQLPSLARDVSESIVVSKERLEKLGSPRGTIRDQRRYLLQISQSFFQLTRAAIDGVYSDEFFGSSKTDEGCRRRLRAVVQNTLTDFSTKMHKQGRFRRILDLEEADDGQPLAEDEVLRSVYVQEVRQMLHRNRGRELAGTYSPLVVGELFAEQCQPWRALTMVLKDELVAAVRKTSQAVPYHVAAEETAEKLSEVVNEGIDHLSKGLDAVVDEVLATYLAIHPITYNSELVDAVRQAQAERRRRELDARVRLEFGQSILEPGSVFPLSGSKLLELLSIQSGSDTALEASSLAVDYAEAYYAISIKRFIDAISTRAIECQLVQKLPSVLEPEKILLLSNDVVTRLAADSEATISERAYHREKLAGLDKTLLELKRLDDVRPGGGREGLSVAEAETGDSSGNWTSDADRPTGSGSSAPSNQEGVGNGIEPEQRGAPEQGGTFPEQEQQPVPEIEAEFQEDPKADAGVAPSLNDDEGVKVSIQEPEPENQEKSANQTSVAGESQQYSQDAALPSSAGDAASERTFPGPDERNHESSTSANIAESRSISDGGGGRWDKRGNPNWSVGGMLGDDVRSAEQLGEGEAAGTRKQRSHRR
ncbi:hypothetical protein CDD80_1107 [Ophiocordyceps camponoti-rufipedis]|uniref:GED domain-containing protein n=1 Tax=Ophiocordyceps camponoti-rufipedis TaxID=2004952 RepID=A0A2C5ZAM9_9HYPO|nr:hypothetical protein CDD80_1107 [Ophiocordyceps camponoti-rufipedis]